MKKMLYALAAASAVAVAAPASAATVVYTTGPTVALTFNAMTNDYDGAFRFRAINMTPGDPNGDFTATFTFVSPINGAGSAIAGNVIVSADPESDIDFTSAFLNSTPGTVLNFGAASSSFVIDAPVTLGLNTLTISGRVNPDGNRVGDGLVTGSLTIAAVAGVVPEPATWGLFILGFGAIGGALRRRASQIRVSKAKLHFA